jgi:hypothetical protein
VVNVGKCIISLVYALDANNYSADGSYEMWKYPTTRQMKETAGMLIVSQMMIRACSHIT